MRRSFVIPVLDFSPHAPYNIGTLLADLDGVAGEVICVFNAEAPFARLRDHPRIDKWAFNKTNAGVPRSWNQGFELAEGELVYVLNADLKLSAASVTALDEAQRATGAAMLGPEGSDIGAVWVRSPDGRQRGVDVRVTRHWGRGAAAAPTRVTSISGFFFALDAAQFRRHGLRFDVAYSPCFFEEWDIAMRLLELGLTTYVVPVPDYDHVWGISQKSGAVIDYFGRATDRDATHLANANRFAAKWRPLFERIAVTEA
jgi:GT2 family glycosyltransferase